MNDSRFKPEAPRVKLAPYCFHQGLSRVHALVEGDGKTLIRFVLVLPPHRDRREGMMCELYNNN